MSKYASNQRHSEKVSDVVTTSTVNQDESIVKILEKEIHCWLKTQVSIEVKSLYYCT